ncbi:dipeptidase PepE [Riemerella columbina]|uniref:dipeptidase PepE n=1 Tax=Riemerella columbina TaxID=103810 RepID=UPI00266EF47A|nr:dipeptidase PepE [Riemerella columbina]WKS96135.1 dipeptidase PepE [Riemerella columbina]
MNVILASTSAVYGGAYLEYLKEELQVLYRGIDELLFIPYARPQGLTYDEYTARAAEFFNQLGIKVKGIHEFENPQTALREAKAFFTGGGNTFLLVKTLHENQLMTVLREEITKGKPYLGTSAGSNIGGLNMQTTNDMPIVFTPSFECMGLVPFNLNPHYLDADPTLKHNGETRETRIKEFLSQNDTPVVGLREGNWIRILGEEITVQGPLTTRIFEKNKTPYEVESGTVLTF